MKKSRLLFASVLVLFGSIILLPGISPVHAQTGTVCIIPTSTSSCPSSPATITGTVGTQLTVSVFIQGSDHINGFDITLLANHTIIKPAGFDLSGTILASPQSVVLECLGGRLVSGSFCSPTDTTDTLHLSVAGAAGQLSSATTGLLFHAIYNVTSSSAGTNLGFQTGCGSSTQPTSHTPLCVTITNGAITPVPENVQTAVFNTGPPADFTLTVTPSTQTVARGSSVSFTVQVTGTNGFGGTVNLSTTVTPNVHHGPTTTLPSSVGPNSSSTLTVSTTHNTPTGTYTITVTGTSGSLSHSASVTVTVTR